VLVIGSKNSSNSLRLVETAKELGKPAYLIDDQSEISASWFEGVDCVMITAGASAPEHLVQAVSDRLQRDYGAQTELRSGVEAEMSLERPESLGSLAGVASLKTTGGCAAGGFAPAPQEEKLDAASGVFPGISRTTRPAPTPPPTDPLSRTRKTLANPRTFW